MISSSLPLLPSAKGLSDRSKRRKADWGSKSARGRSDDTPKTLHSSCQITGWAGDWWGPEEVGGWIIFCICLACSQLKNIAKQLLKLEGCTPSPRFLLRNANRRAVTWLVLVAFWRGILTVLVMDVRSLKLSQASWLDINNWGWEGISKSKFKSEVSSPPRQHGWC